MFLNTHTHTHTHTRTHTHTHTHMHIEGGREPFYLFFIAIFSLNLCLLYSFALQSQWNMRYVINDIQTSNIQKSLYVLCTENYSQVRTYALTHNHRYSNLCRLEYLCTYDTTQQRKSKIRQTHLFPSQIVYPWFSNLYAHQYK